MAITEFHSAEPRVVLPILADVLSRILAFFEAFAKNSRLAKRKPVSLTKPLRCTELTALRRFRRDGHMLSFPDRCSHGRKRAMTALPSFLDRSGPENMGRSNKGLWAGFLVFVV